MSLTNLSFFFLKKQHISIDEHSKKSRKKNLQNTNDEIFSHVRNLNDFHRIEKQCQF